MQLVVKMEDEVVEKVEIEDKEDKEEEEEDKTKAEEENGKVHNKIGINW